MTKTKLDHENEKKKVLLMLQRLIKSDVITLVAIWYIYIPNFRKLIYFLCLVDKIFSWFIGYILGIFLEVGNTNFMASANKTSEATFRASPYYTQHRARKLFTVKDTAVSV